MTYLKHFAYLCGFVLVCVSCEGQLLVSSAEDASSVTLPDATTVVDVQGPVADASVGQDSQDLGPVCGNGKIETDEECDDGNARPADGCSGICAVEPGYTCPEPGKSCELNSDCGNGKVEQGEACDDGDLDLGDGCDDNCEVEAGWSCGISGCVETTEEAVCGNGDVEYGEQCDDGDLPPESDDGCDASCQVEDGYVCPTPGAACELLVTEYCGDGDVNNDEECDDANVKPGDGCSITCKVETGYVCTDDGCSVKCGDLLVVGTEACDDGNEAGDDGCAADCSQVESGYVCPVAAGVGGTCMVQQAGAICPNGQLEFGEQCDDGNDTPDDGCSGCVIDEGYRCPVAGTLCEKLPVCGDGNVDLTIGEECDDGDEIDTNGCTADCKVAAGFICPVPQVSGDKLVGGDCRAIVCRDGVIEGTEQCDDGNTLDGDGCSAGCLLESGWTCPLGASCQARECGDGIKAGFEECDNGDQNGSGVAVDNVVCDAGCLIVADPALCGNGDVDPGEACDDGNNNLGDGCTVFCEREPSCAPPLPCTTECGDGIRFGDDEECDDGNTRNGDGCSSTCAKELGFYCEEASGDTLTIPIVYRDFKAYQNGGHVAFQWSSEDPIDRTPEQDIWVRTTLGTSADTTPEGTSLLGKPIFKWYAECDGAGCTDIVPNAGVSQPDGTGGAADCNAVKDDGTGTRYIDADNRDVYFCGYGAQDYNTFSQWYRDVEGVNMTIPTTLTLDRQTGGEYMFSDSSFFPLTDLGFGNEDWSENFHFTSEVRYWFRYDEASDATLSFTGDDDVWVFVNGQLTVDISGTHGATTDSVTVNAATTNIEGVSLNLQQGEVYEIVMFQAERNTSGSNYQLTLQDFHLARSTCHSECGDGIKASNEQCDRGNTCDDGSTCTNGLCDNGSTCNDNSYGGCTTSCELGPYCGDGETNGDEACDDALNNAVYSDTPNGACAPGCVFAPYCGDGQVAVGIEQCDGGSECESDCTLTPRCGDGDIDDGEQCDDGEALNGTVSSTCDVQCRTKCGNESIDAGEQCDPGVGNFSSEYGGCLPAVGEQAGCILGLRCGDGVQNGPEACDDGRNDGSYGTCAPGCVLGARCGDGAVQSIAGEFCDNGEANTTVTYAADGKGLCTTACRNVGYCGDAAVTNGEACDDGVNDGTPGSCETDCSAWVELASCGNGNTDTGEQCDDGDNNGAITSDCDQYCRFRCGNGIVDEGEQCDDGVNDGRYGTCGTTCQFAAYCGDDAINGPEECDDGDDNQASAYGPGLCDSTCHTAPYCGDGRIQSEHGEKCDGQPGCLNDCTWVVVY